MEKKTIKRLREERDMSQEDLARVTGLSVYTISRYEREGVKSATLFNVLVVAEALGSKVENIKWE